MKLSTKERLILINQYEILKNLEPKENKDRYDEIIAILTWGYKIFYDSTFNIPEEMSEIESKLVLDILSFYRIVESYKDKNKKDKNIIGHRYGYFNGFDGNEEAQYLGFVHFLIHTQGKFTENKIYEKKNDNFNSHYPEKSKYQNMIKKWEELGKKWDLSKSEILLILDS